MNTKHLRAVCLATTLAALAISGALILLGSQPAHASSNVLYVAPGGPRYIPISRALIYPRASLPLTRRP